MTWFGQLSGWLRRKDSDLAATRRAARTALVLPSLFALCTEALHEPVIGTFAAFSSFSMLLLIDLAGPLVQRVRAHAALTVAWLLLVTLGTLAGREPWIAVLATVVIGFLVLFSGVVSSVLAASTTGLLLAFILPVSAPAPLSDLPDRLFGVLLAGVVSMAAVAVLWPRMPVNPLVRPAAAACRAAARQLHADAAHSAALARGETFTHCRLRARETAATTDELRKAFTATPYRPTGLSTGSRALVRLVDELTWLSAVLAESGPTSAEAPSGDADSATVRRAAAGVLEIAADMLEQPGGSPDRLRAAAEDLRKSLGAMEDGAVGRLPARDEARGEQDLDAFLTDLDVSFRAQEVAFVVLQIAQNVETSRAADQRSWPERLFGREPGSSAGAWRSARERAAAHLEPHSVWLHNSIRGAVGLGIGVAIAETISVQHAFWVMLGTLSVLRSNALNTGQNVFRALGGTIAGSIAGAGVLALIGQDRPLLWVLLPIAVLGAGIVPAAISFAAGQAAFTLTLVILFNVAQPAGLSIIFFRIEDIAIGCGVSLVVGLFFWPRGASSAVSRALSEAYVDSARYLVGAVDYAVSRCACATETREVAQEERRAAAAARRLDDTFRTYLAERGAKAVPLGEMTTLVTGVVALRLAADAILELWRRAGKDLPARDRAAAQQELLIMAERTLRWYQGLAEGLEGAGPVPEPLLADREVVGRLVQAVRRDLRDEEGRATGTGVRIIWTGDHLEAIRRLQSSLTHSFQSARPEVWERARQTA
ncbi:FUSC family protein [Actinospica robiniae]|uniref:FUSC family protein n=1 Tax=Actinospica robiniae TaxID=304901 RepID=UPI0004215A16|nr:FUSC family protein [Actinospica robiniae]